MSAEPLTVRPLTGDDIRDADRIFRLAFGTWLNLPDPMQFAGDASWIASRFAGRLGGAQAACAGDSLIGSNFTANRGSVGCFGPLTVHPDWWGKGAGQALVAAAVDDFDRWGVRHGGLYTFAQSVLHVGLYRKFGFWPGHLTGVLVRQLTAGAAPPRETVSYAAVDAAGRAALERAADGICASVLDGLTVVPELRAVLAGKLGDTVFVSNGAVQGFAVCHCGAGTEAGTGTCRVKFAAAASGAAFERLAAAWEAFAWSRGTPRVEAGINFGRELASRALLARGYVAVRHGVAMYRPNDPAYDRVDAWVVDDWR